jgi:hypothetical protein
MIDHTPEEDEAFSAMEQSSVRKEIISNPSKEARLLMEVALLTDLVRELAERVRQLEAKQ